jgi:hypothetical protein
LAQTFREQAPGLASATVTTTYRNVGFRGDESALRPGLQSDYIFSGHLPPGINNANIPALIRLDVTGGVHPPLRLAA